jgi:hypothetical protein
MEKQPSNEQLAKIIALSLGALAVSAYAYLR